MVNATPPAVPAKTRTCGSLPERDGFEHDGTVYFEAEYVEALESQFESLKQELARLRKDYGVLREALKDAIGCAEEWAAYASEYFQDKHDLGQDLERLNAALASTPPGEGE